MCEYCEKDKIHKSGTFTSRALAIFPKEFKAIREQMKELGWLDE